MQRILGMLAVSAVILCFAGGISRVAAQSEFKDMPYFSGMPNYRIADSEDKEFDQYAFHNGKDCSVIEGKKFFRTYTLQEEKTSSSELQIARNYANALKSKGGAVLFDGECQGVNCAENCGYRMMTGKLKSGNGELWMEVVPFNGGNDYYLTVVAVEAMKNEVTASGILDALNRDGRIALYINFDTGKSTIKPDSRPIIAQIVDMMKANPAIRLSVEGHTDNVGSAPSNKTLSDQRANAVVAAIKAEGIDAARMSAAGFGQEKPVADNATEEGRAKNRRVELVKK